MGRRERFLQFRSTGERVALGAFNLDEGLDDVEALRLGESTQSTASINALSTTLIPSSELLASKPRDYTLKQEQNSCYEHDKRSNGREGFGSPLRSENRLDRVGDFLEERARVRRVGEKFELRTCAFARIRVVVQRLEVVTEPEDKFFELRFGNETPRCEREIRVGLIAAFDWRVVHG